MIIDIQAARKSSIEQERIADLMSILPDGNAVLDIGARDGYISQLLAGRYERVTALDLVKPSFDIDRVETIQGNVLALQFPDNAFDTVVCMEVLEHLAPGSLQTACDELTRVARGYVVIGVPYRQDLRVGRMTCQNCGGISPAWNHLNSFDKDRLQRLFRRLNPVSVTFVGRTRARTNALSAWLLNRAGNPWGNFYQDERCLHCDQPLSPPMNRTLFQRACSAVAFLLQQGQRPFIREHANWIHIVFQKTSAL